MAMVCEGECMRHIPEYEPLTFTRCYRCLLSQLYVALLGESPLCGQAYNLKRIKGLIYFFFFFFRFKLYFSSTVAGFVA